MTEDMHQEPTAPCTRRVFLSLGSNIGDPEANLQEAVRLITCLPGLRIAGKSSVYHTEPQGVRDQPWFTNQVLELECNTSWTPETLLNALLSLEIQMGRTRDLRWGPRIIDIDILVFDSEVRTTQALQLPHPRMRERAFVLIPLAEIAPDLCPGPEKKNIQELLEQISFDVEGTVITQSS